VAAASPIAERREIVTWDVGTLPPVVRGADGSLGYPALLDEGDAVALRILTNPELQQRVMRGGVHRLLDLTAAPSIGSIRAGLDQARRTAVGVAGIPLDDLAADARAAAVDAVLDEGPGMPWDEAAFVVLAQTVRADALAVARRALETAADVLAAETRVRLRLAELTAASAQPVVADAEAHLARLLRPGFVVTAGARRLPDVLRYVRGIEHRVERLDVDRDARPAVRAGDRPAGRRRGRLAPRGTADQHLRPTPRHPDVGQPDPPRQAPRRAGRLRTAMLRPRFF
jgi:ATP-dependent helicase HrpA